MRIGKTFWGHFLVFLDVYIPGDHVSSLSGSRVFHYSDSIIWTVQLVQIHSTEKTNRLIIIHGITCIHTAEDLYVALS